jgi:4-carboxymuconolactone decarboxylase
MDDHDEGMRVRRHVLCEDQVDHAAERTTPVTANYQDMITRYAWGAILARPELDRRIPSAITLTALVAQARDDELAMHVRAAVGNGLREDEIMEALFQSAIYCGVPAANSAVTVAKPVLEEIAK